MFIHLVWRGLFPRTNIQQSYDIRCNFVRSCNPSETHELMEPVAIALASLTYQNCKCLWFSIRMRYVMRDWQAKGNQLLNRSSCSWKYYTNHLILRKPSHKKSNKGSVRVHELSVYTYIYIYIYVCVCRKQKRSWICTSIFKTSNLQHPQILSQKYFFPVAEKNKPSSNTSNVETRPWCGAQIMTLVIPSFRGDGLGPKSKYVCLDKVLTYPPKWMIRPVYQHENCVETTFQCIVVLKFIFTWSRHDI